MDENIQNWLQDPGFQQLSPERQQRIVAGYFTDSISDEFNALPEDHQQEIVADFVNAHLPQEEIPSRTVSGTLKDVAISAGKGVVGLGESAVGLADIPTLGYVGKALESLGYDPEATKEFLGQYYSPAQKAATEEVGKAKGFVGKTKAMLQHPSTVGHAVVESAPLMLGGAAGARALLAKGLVASPLTAGAIGEGLVSAGGAAEEVRQQTEDGLLTPKESLISVVSGIGTGVFALAGGRAAQKLGIIDVDTLLAGGSNVSSTGVAKRIIGGGISEGVFEELPQSMQEQVWLNAALDKPLLENVPEAGATGTLVGFAMGTGANIFIGKTQDIAEPTSEQMSDMVQGVVSEKVYTTLPDTDLNNIVAKTEELSKTLPDDKGLREALDILQTEVFERKKPAPEEVVPPVKEEVITEPVPERVEEVEAVEEIKPEKKPKVSPVYESEFTEAARRKMAEELRTGALGVSGAELLPVKEPTGKERILAKVQERKLKSREISKGLYGTKKQAPFKTIGAARLSRKGVSTDIGVPYKELEAVETAGGWVLRQKVQPVIEAKPTSDTPASKIVDATMVNDETMGAIKQRVLEGNKGVKKELEGILEEHGRETLQDWMNPMKMRARLKADLDAQGISKEERKAELKPIMTEYEKIYNEVSGIVAVTGEQIAKELDIEYQGIWEVKGKKTKYAFQVPEIGNIMVDELDVEKIRAYIAKKPKAAPDIKREVVAEKVKEPWEMTRKGWWKDIIENRVNLPVKDGYANMPRTHYIRFGEVARNEKGEAIPSTNWLINRPEKGISVFPAWKDEKTGKYVIASESEDLINLIATSGITDRDIYIIDGDFSGKYGADGEPLLKANKNIKLARVLADDVVEEQDPWRSVIGTEFEKKDIPDWEISEQRMSEVFPPEHKKIVQKALSEGKPVPKEVLAEYPDLKPKEVPAKEIPTDKDDNELVDITGTPIETNPDRTITLYHRTTAEKAKSLRETGKFRSLENADETFFSNKIKGQAEGYGDTVVAIKVNPSQTRLDDAFRDGEIHVTVSNKLLSKANIVKEAKKKPKPIRVKKKELTPKQQKAYLIDEIDKAVEVAPEVKPPVKPEVLGEFEELPSMLKLTKEGRVYAKKVEQKEKRKRKKIVVSERDIEKFDKFGPLDDQKIVFIHHLIHKYGKPLVEAKKIADGFYGGTLDADGVRAALAKPVNVVQAKTRLKSRLKDQKGAFSLKSIEGPAILEDLVTVGKDVIGQGYDTYSKFAAQMKATLGEVWENVKGFMLRVYSSAQKALKSEVGAITVKEVPYGVTQPESARKLLDAINNAEKKKKTAQDKKSIGDIKDTTKAILRGLDPKKTGVSRAIESVLKSPEWYDHPIQKGLVDDAIDRSRIFHEYFNDFNQVDDINSPFDTVSDALVALARKGDISKASFLFGTRSKAYKQLEEILNEADIKNEKLTEEILTKRKVDEDVIHVWSLVRHSYDKQLEAMQKPMRELIEQIEERAAFEGVEPVYPDFGNYIDEKGKKRSLNLKEALMMMGNFKGSYAPRIRERGDWVVQGRMGISDRVRYHKRTKIAAELFKNKLEREGYSEVTVKAKEQLPEATYQAIRLMETGAAVERAAQSEGIKKYDVELQAKFMEDMLIAVADMIKSRGARSTMIRRQTGKVITGYIEDPIERYTRYTLNNSSGMAKGETAKVMFKRLYGEHKGGKKVGGLDIAKEPAVHTASQKYITEQLRNAERADRIIGLAKSLATFKYLGFNPRSVSVNVTSLFTSAPTAIQQYAMGGKGSFTKINAEMVKASWDFGKFMFGKSLKTVNEQQFLMEVKREGRTDAQYTREAVGHIQGAYGTVWSKTMGASMWGFGKSEEWVRGTTMLAAYRLARKQGIDPKEAFEKAVDASNKAHGIYGKATLPTIAQGTGPGARLGQAFYVYLKYPHNYLQMLYDIGMKKKNVKGFLYAMAAPAVLGGLKAVPMAAVMIGFVNAVMKALGDDRDAEKLVYDTIEEQLGETTEKAMRGGALGMMGVDISGSLSMGPGAVPTKLIDLTGALGGVVQDVVQGGRFLLTGQPLRAVEKILPSFAANPLRAIRELSGVVTRRGNRVWDEQGMPYFPIATETAKRAVGFRSARRARLAEKTWHAKRELARFNKRKGRIYETYRAYLIRPTQKLQDQIMEDIVKYNEQVLKMRQKGNFLIPFITKQSMINQIRRMFKPTKKQREMVR